MAKSSGGADFTLDDFKRQLERFASPGLIRKVLWLMPGMGQIREMLGNPETQKDTRRLIGIINSMTPQERRDGKLNDRGRRQRIAKGAGVRPHEVSRLFRQFQVLRPIIVAKSDSERRRIIEDLRGGDTPGLS